MDELKSGCYDKMTIVILLTKKKKKSIKKYIILKRKDLKLPRDTHTSSGTHIQMSKGQKMMAE
ncbi:hypothetical protein SK128_011793 [Halocaridina rubra]|uniref:Uncharacterized protein n=1 Tax=Halocaridina rubra TaxID=373956 RepID=A0AAN8XGR9_HALRR